MKFLVMIFLNIPSIWQGMKSLKKKLIYSVAGDFVQREDQSYSAVGGEENPV